MKFGPGHENSLLVLHTIGCGKNKNKNITDFNIFTRSFINKH